MARTPGLLLPKLLKYIDFPSQQIYEIIGTPPTLWPSSTVTCPWFWVGPTINSKGYQRIKRDPRTWSHYPTYQHPNPSPSMMYNGQRINPRNKLYEIFFGAIPDNHQLIHQDPVPNKFDLNPTHWSAIYVAPKEPVLPIGEDPEEGILELLADIDPRDISCLNDLEATPEWQSLLMDYDRDYLMNLLPKTELTL